MRKILLVTLLLISSLFSLQLIAQEVVWPGDVNNNGIVDQTDLLYLGPVMFQFGPQRTEIGIEWGPYDIDQLWGMLIPGTTIDLAYADTDGDGFISFADVDALYENFNQEHGTVIQDTAPTAEIDIDPQLFFNFEQVPDIFFEAQLAFIPIQLGTEEIMIENFSGISFEITYDPAILSVDNVFFELQDPWFDPFGNNTLDFKVEEEGIIYVSISTLNPAFIGNGIVGIFGFVVEDDVIGVNDPEVETTLQIQEVILLNGGSDVVPTNPDTLIITISDPFTSGTSDNKFDNFLELMPNPTSDYFVINLEEPIEEVKIYDNQGKCVREIKARQKNLKVNVEDLECGVYHIQIFQGEKRYVEKLIKH